MDNGVLQTKTADCRATVVHHSPASSERAISENGHLSGAGTSAILYSKQGVRMHSDQIEPIGLRSVSESAVCAARFMFIPVGPFGIKVETIVGCANARAGFVLERHAGDRKFI